MNQWKNCIEGTKRPHTKPSGNEQRETRERKNTSGFFLLWVAFGKRTGPGTRRTTPFFLEHPVGRDRTHTPLLFNREKLRPRREKQKRNEKKNFIERLCKLSRVSQNVSKCPLFRCQKTRVVTGVVCCARGFRCWLANFACSSSIQRSANFSTSLPLHIFKIQRRSLFINNIHSSSIQWFSALIS